MTPDDIAAHTLTIIDANEAPLVADQTMSIQELSVSGTAVGTLAASDVDAGDSLSYSITTGNTDGAFAIDPVTGEITLANPDALGLSLNPGFGLGVQVQDASGLTTVVEVTVTVDPAPDVEDEMVKGVVRMVKEIIDRE